MRAWCLRPACDVARRHVCIVFTYERIDRSGACGMAVSYLSYPRMHRIKSMHVQSYVQHVLVKSSSPTHPRACTIVRQIIKQYLQYGP
jgi:hypothetical protein